MGRKMMISEFYGLEKVKEEVDDVIRTASLSSIPQPQTPKEPMEFLSRSWSLSASQISKALSQKPEFNPNFLFPDKIHPPQSEENVENSTKARKIGSIGKWFHYKEFSIAATKKKDTVRLEKARLHSALSVAALAAALAAVAATGNCPGSKRCTALESATELLASHCVAVAELAGAGQDRVASVVKSAVDIQSPSDLITLTAAAATALRAEAALKARMGKEARKKAAISPCEKRLVETHWPGQITPPFAGELMQCTQNGALRWKHVTVYINKKHQVLVKLKSTHIGGAFSKKSIVYGICGETSDWPYRKERQDSDEVYLGLKTAKGIVEFKCKNKIHRQKWVDEIRLLLHQVSLVETTQCSLQALSMGGNCGA